MQMNFVTDIIFINLRWQYKNFSCDTFCYFADQTKIALNSIELCKVIVGNPEKKCKIKDQPQIHASDVLNLLEI